MDQFSFASLDFAAKKKRTKRDVRALTRFVASCAYSHPFNAPSPVRNFVGALESDFAEKVPASQRAGKKPPPPKP